MMKLKYISTLALLGVVFATGCNRQDMRNQARYKPLAPSAFFDNGQASRPLIEHTIARGQLRLDTHLYEGRIDGEYAASFPMPLTQAILDRGQQRYGIYCTPCHDKVGTGNGMVVQRGFTHPTSYHDLTLRNKPAGYYFEVISKGFGRMQDYAAQINPEDRWAIVAYIRALQLSQGAEFAALPQVDQKAIKASADAQRAVKEGTHAGEHH